MEQNCSPATCNNSVILRKDTVKHLGLHTDGRLTWKQHIEVKCKQLKLKVKRYCWFSGKRYNLSLEHKLLLCKVILKLIWTYEIQLWGAASNSNIEILHLD